MKAPIGIALSFAAAACVPPPPSAVAPVDAGPPADAGMSDAGGPGSSYAIVVLPDTQYYASSWPEIFDAQTQWIADNREALQIAFVLHTGDIVDADVPEQWEAARRSLATIEGRVPFALAAGNHDYANIADRMGMINAFFPPSRFAANPWFGGTFEPEHLENSYYRFDAGSGQWLVLALEFGPRDEVLAWADGVLKAFRETPAIVITHAYLTHDGTRYDATVSPHQLYNPHDYVMMGQPRTTINDGEEMWQKLIRPNGNVKLVFSGHDVSGDGLPPGTAAHLTSTRTDGSAVHELLANYQTCVAAPCETFGGNAVRGGNGYLRILRVSPADKTVSISTYSPYLHRTLEDPSNAFTLSMN